MSPSPFLPGPGRGGGGRRLVPPHRTPGSTGRPASTGLTGPSLSPERGAKPVTSFVKNLSALSDWHSVYTSAIAFTVSAPCGRAVPSCLGLPWDPLCRTAQGRLSLSLPTCEVGAVMPPGGGGWEDQGRCVPWPPAEPPAQDLLCSALLPDGQRRWQGPYLPVESGVPPLVLGPGRTPGKHALT